MKKSIYEKELENPKFKAVYDEIAATMSIGEQIAQLRHKAHMSQLELARKTKSSRSAIARYESGTYNNYNIRTLMRIAKAFRTKLNVSFS